MSTKLCSACQQERPEADYSGAQLKKKGKRVCKHCLSGGDAGSASAGSNEAQQPSAAAQQLAALLSAHSARNGGPHAAVAAAPAPVVELGPDPAPAHPLFPGQRSSLWDAERSIAYYTYSSEERHLAPMQRLIEADLSEPYSVFTYRYFLNFWPKLAFMAMKGSDCIGCIVCRLTVDKASSSRRGYIAMLAVSPAFRGAGLGTTLVTLALESMKSMGAQLCVLEAETTNKAALALYEKLNFVRETRLVKYYLSGSDAFRLKLWLQPPGAEPLAAVATDHPIIHAADDEE